MLLSFKFADKRGREREGGGRERAGGGGGLCTVWNLS